MTAAAPPLAAQSRTSLRDVLARAGDYVVQYGRALASVIGEEAYVQALVGPADETLEERVLHAEIIFVPLPGGREWQAVRNVLRMDGHDVPEADGRLERLLRGGASSLVTQGRRMAAESARYNLGPLLRTFNAPTMPMQFLHPGHQDRFRFRRAGEEDLAGEPIWIVSFRDRGGATLIRSTTGRAVPIEGRFWMAPSDGRLVRASFRATGFLPEERGQPRATASLDVRWRPDDRLNLWVPAEMQERYTGPWADRSVPYDITGAARYSAYRRFEVDVRVLPVPR